MSPWLPRTTLLGERAAQPFVTAVAEWSDAWFPARGWQAATAFDVAAEGKDWSVLRDDASYSVVGRPKASIELAFAVLDQRPRQDLTQADQQLMRRVASAALDDLHRRITHLIPAALRQNTGGHHRKRMRLAIGPDARPCLALEVEPGILTALVKTGFRSLRPRADLFPPRAAVAQEPVRFEAHLGSASLSIGQIESLEPGDIVVLDRSPEAPARICVNNRLSPMAFALGDDGRNVTLTLQD